MPMKKPAGLFSDKPEASGLLTDADGFMRGGGCHDGGAEANEAPLQIGGGNVKDSFPVLGKADPEDPFVYLDSAATSLMPQSVIDAIAEYEETSRSNIHRGIHCLAEHSTDLYESARERLASFVGVRPDNLIITHGATESINIIAQGWVQYTLKKGDTIVLFMDNHHANIVPWQMIAEKKELNLVFVKVLDNGSYDHDSWEKARGLRPKLVACTHVSNVTGIEHDIAKIAYQAHEAGAYAMADCAQSFGHGPLSVGGLGLDMAVGSCHKAYGPFGFGFLSCTSAILERMVPVYGGGGMIKSVGTESFIPAESVSSFEAGTPVVSAAAGVKASLDFIESIGTRNLANHTRNLCDMLDNGLKQLRGVKLIAEGTGRHRSILSFTCEGWHPHDIASRLDEKGIAVRAGHHCAMPLHKALRVPASIRASFGVYNDERDVEKLLSALDSIMEEGKNGVSYRHRR